jgi:hypothetical protein
MANVTIELLEPKLGGEVSRVVLRPPTADEFWRLGEPVRFVSTGSSIYQVEDPDIIRAYLDILVVEPNIKAHTKHLGLADAMRVREALFDFFEAARGKMQPAAPSSSPSTSNGSPSSTADE